MAQWFDVSRMSLSSENKIMKQSIYIKEMNVIMMFWKRGAMFYDILSQIFIVKATNMWEIMISDNHHHHH